MLLFLESLGHIVLVVLANGLWQGALIALLTWGALRVFSRANASTRYAVWVLALVAIVVVPLATSLSRISVHVEQHSATSDAAPAGNQLPRIHTLTSAPSPRSVAAPVPLVNAPVRSVQVSLPTAIVATLLGIWLFAAAILLGRVGIGLASLERLKRDSLPLSIDYRDTMPRWEAALKGHRDVRICTCDEIDVPVAVGLFDAMILLPAHLVRSLDPAEIDQISLHELAHLLRSDDWTNAMARVISALLFLNPAVWFVVRQMDIEREVACDDFVLGLTGDVRPYAFCLTKMAEMTPWPHRAMAAPGVFVTRKSISIRIERLLRTGRSVGSSVTASIAGCVATALLILFFVIRAMTPSVAFAENQPAIQVTQHLAVHATHIATHATAWKSRLPHATTALRSPTYVAPVVGTRLPSVPIINPRAPRLAVATQPPSPASYTTIDENVAHIVNQALQRAHVAELAVDASRCSGCSNGNHNLIGADFRNQSLRGANFSNRSLTGADFRNADLLGASFDHAILTGVNFDGANLRNVSFVGAQLEGCNMRNAQLAGTRFDAARISGCDINVRALSAEQTRAIIGACEGCDFAHANLRGMDLRQVHLEGADLQGADLRGADLSGAVFIGVDFHGVRFDGANVNNAEFNGCNFSHADLRHVDLSKATFTGSAMSDAIMHH